MLIDESSSLVTDPAPGTDPDGRRVDGMNAAIDGMVRLSSKGADGGGVDVSLMFAGFADKYTPVGAEDNFMEVTQDSEASLVAAAESFRARYNGKRTDFAVALQGAVDSFNARSAQQTSAGEQAACKALVMFTDGVLSVGSASKKAAKVADLCNADGIADQTRTNQIIMLAIALAGIAPPRPDDDPLLLQRVAIGTDSNGATCGTTGSDQTGLYIPVADRDQLVADFENLFNPPQPPTTTTPSTPASSEPTSTTVPPGPARCSADTPCTGTFRVPATVSEFRFGVTVGDPTATISMRAPDGSQATFSGDKATTATAGATTLEFRPSSATSSTVSADVQPADDGEWTWTIAYPSGTKDSAQPTHTLAYSSNVVASVAAPTTLRPGHPEQLTVGLVGPDGKAVALPDASVSVQLSQPGATTPTDVAMTGPDAQGAYSGQVGVEATSTASKVNLAMQVVLPDVDGVPVGTRISSAQISVQVPGAIVITPDPLQAPSIGRTAGSKSSTALIHATAPANGGGCVWIEPAALQVKKHTVNVAADAATEATCVRVEAGTTVDIPVEFDVNRPTRSTATGTILVHTKNDDPVVGQRVVAVHVSVDLTIPPDIGARVVVVVLSILVAILLTLLVLHLLALWTARFRGLNVILPFAVDVIVVPGAGVFPADQPPGTTLTIPGRASIDPWVRAPGVYRERSHSSFDFRTRPTRFWTFSARAVADGPFAEVLAHSPYPVTAGAVTKEKLRTRPEHGISDVPLALSGTWVFRRTGVTTADVSGGQATGYTGTLLLLIGAGDDTPDGNEMLISASELLVQRVASMIKPTKHPSQKVRRAFPGRGQRSGSSPPDELDPAFQALIDE